MALASLAALAVLLFDGSDFRVQPYLQNPTRASVDVRWISHSHAAGTLRCYDGSRLVFVGQGQPQPATALGYGNWETTTFFHGQAPDPGFQQQVTIAGLQQGHQYRYRVSQGDENWERQFQTAPGPDSPVRFMAYADCETEPESTGYKTLWERGDDKKRAYLVDQTDGYAANLAAIRDREPNFVVIAGDLVESGGEQRDWDEFWKQNANFAGRIPIFAAIGNHEYYGGPKNGAYQSERAVEKWLAYFHFPSPTGRYYRADYGPISLIVIDACNGKPEKSERDTNHYLDSATDFNPGSEQYRWLEQQLAEAQRNAKFTFVAFHHCPYSSGPHGVPQDPQSGEPVRILTPLFQRYGVDALLTGHDEMWERSELPGVEELPDGKRRPYALQVYDVGIGGDGLRSPEPSAHNSAQRFLADKDAPEVWKEGVLVSGGRHYGHLEVDVAPTPQGWTATLTPVYLFPVVDASGKCSRFERRVYHDTIRLLSSPG